MRNYLVILAFFLTTMIQAQIMVPAYQSVQYRKNTLPTITTTAITSITATTANSGGAISNQGIAPITVKGICWGIVTRPTIALVTKTTDGSGTGSFTSALTNLASGTIYYVRAYATNSVGTSYGNEISFTTTCGAYVAAGVWKEFACYNLGATDTTSDPNVPVQGIHGNYYQWGRSTAVADASTASGAISGWNATAADNGAWSDTSKTANDPCPSGFKVPIIQQWQGVINAALNTITRTGTWATSSTNFATAISFGTSTIKTLTLPAAGFRSSSLFNRGSLGYYRSSTEDGANAWTLYFTSSSASATSYPRDGGFSVRCVNGSFTVPNAPTSPVATASNAQASVAFTSPIYNGGFAITGYTVTSSPGGFTATGASSPIVFTNLNGGISYTFTVVATNELGNSVASAASNAVTTKCGAYVAAGVWKEFACHNLGATTALDPNTPVQGIHGNYYQWGRNTVVADASTAAAGAIVGWNTTYAANGSWSDGSKTTNDPCPTGFRVPTQAQWDGVIANNIVSRTGSWANDGNFTTAIHWGSNASTKTLTLPASGSRSASDGSLSLRGYYGIYWSSTENGANAWYLDFTSSVARTYPNGRAYGFSVRCVNGSFTVPNAPTSPVATASNAQASVAFTAPVSDGGSAITGYTVTSSPGGFTATGTTSPIIVTGLTNGTSYTFAVVATNEMGNSVASAASNAVTPMTVPNAPTSPVATASNAQASVVFTAPIYNGGGAITGYTVTSSPGGFTATGASSPIVFTNLNGGISYTFTVVATNAAGNSIASAASNAVTPNIIPNAPTSPVATASNAQASVAFTAPVANGGTAITGYTVTSSPGGLTATGSTSPIVFTNLNGGISYTFTVVATNAMGNSVASAASNAVTTKCGAFVATGVWKEFACHNLGATTALDPNTPVQGIHGNYYQWGRNTVVADASTTTDDINGWNTTPAANGSWSDGSKTTNDPCPTGFRVPTKAQWDGVVFNNTVSRTGSWAFDGNFTTAIHWGPNASTKTLTLPAAGSRSRYGGNMDYRGSNGMYWSSTEYGPTGAYSLTYNGSITNNFGVPSIYGYSVRCVSE